MAMSTFDDTDQFMVLDTKPSDSQFLTEMRSGLDWLCRCCKSLSSLMLRPPTSCLIAVAAEDGDDEEEEKVEEEIYKLMTLWSLDTVIDFP